MLVDCPINLWTLFVWVSWPAQHSNSGSTNGMSLGACLSVCSTNGRWGSVYETCLKTKTSTLNSTIRRPFTPLVFSLLYLLIWLLFSTISFTFSLTLFLSLLLHLFLIHHLFCLPSVLSFILSPALFILNAAWQSILKSQEGCSFLFAQWGDPLVCQLKEWHKCSLQLSIPLPT